MKTKEKILETLRKNKKWTTSSEIARKNNLKMSDVTNMLRFLSTTNIIKRKTLSQRFGGNKFIYFFKPGKYKKRKCANYGKNIDECEKFTYQESYLDGKVYCQKCWLKIVSKRRTKRRNETRRK